MSALERMQLVTPYGECLVDLTVQGNELDTLKAYAKQLPTVRLSERAICDLEMLAVGALSPLDRFMGREDLRRVQEEMRLAAGHLFPVPITLPVEAAPGVNLGQDVALCNSRNDILAILTIEELYEWDKEAFARAVCGSIDLRHPLVAELQRWGRLNASGRLQVLDLPRRYDFHDLRLSPSEVRARLEKCGRTNVVAFEASEPLQRVHEDVIKRVLTQMEATLLLQPIVGRAGLQDVNYYTRVRIYRAFAQRSFPPDEAVLSLLPLATRWAGPREALWHALVRRNFGANFVTVGPDYASSGTDSAGRPFYGEHDAAELLMRNAFELGVRVLPFREYFGAIEDSERVADKAGLGETQPAYLSAEELRQGYLDGGRAIPEQFVCPEVAEVLAENYPPRHRQGMCIWFTGLSGAGKSTTAEILAVLLREHGRQVTLLDGDIVRTHLSKGLGFSKEDRDTNILRIGFVAAEIVRHGGVAICAAVSPYRATRDEVRSLVGTDHFLEVFVDTPLQVCEGRDTKGMYAKARRGEIKDFTGVDDPYESPLRPEVTLDTVACMPEVNAKQVLDQVLARGFIRRREG